MLWNFRFYASIAKNDWRKIDRVAKRAVPIEVPRSSGHHNLLRTELHGRYYTLRSRRACKFVSKEISQRPHSIVFFFGRKSFFSLTASAAMAVMIEIRDELNLSDEATIDTQNKQ